MVTGDLNVSGVEYLNASPINGGQLNGDQLSGDQINSGQDVNGGQDVTGKHSFEIANSQLQKARKRLSLSLKKRKITGDQPGLPESSGSENQKEEGIMEIDSDD